MTPFQGKEPARVSPVILGVLEQITSERRLPSADANAAAVAALSRLFTKKRASLGREYLDDPTCSAAYLSYFMPVNLSKIQVLLDELPQDTFVRNELGRFSVLDLGSGPGTGGLAVLDWLFHRRNDSAVQLSVTAVDASDTALRQAERLWDLYTQMAGISGAKFQAHTADLQHLLQGPLEKEISRSGPFDLIILANCLNEMWSDCSDPTDARAGLIATTLSWLSPNGTVMIVEPALRETSRALHRVRDRLLEGKCCTVYSPCLHENNCPALVNADDWCHEERAWKPPAAIQQIDDEVGFIKDALKFSYLLLRTDGRTIARRSANTFRIVSELRELKGDTRAWLCNELGRSEVGRLDRAESETNAVWSDCRRGTIVKVEGLKRKEGATLARIPSEGIVEIIRQV